MGNAFTSKQESPLPLTADGGEENRCAEYGAVARPQEAFVTKTGTWFNLLKLLALCGAGIFADGYDLQVINIVTAILNYQHPEIMTPQAMSWCTSMTLLGVVLGQLIFGFFADRIGRKSSSLATAVLTILGAGLSACVTNDGGVLGLAGDLGLCRFLLGLGMGGEYPISAALALENADKAGLSKQATLQLTMLCFALGWFTMSALVLITLANGMPLNVLWRFALAFGVVPSTIAVVLRWNAHVAEPQPTQDSPNAVRHTGLGWFVSQLDNRRALFFGACLTWSLFNFSSYGQTSFMHVIVDQLFAVPSDSPLRLVKRNAQFAMAASLFSITGALTAFYALSFEFSSYRRVQIVGFFGMTVANWVCAAAPSDTSPSWNVFLMAVSMAWVAASGWVGVATYSVPGEYFPMHIRGTVCGIAAACGKAGAFIGTATFPIAEARYGLQDVLTFGGMVTATGFLATALLTPAHKPERFT